MDDYNPLGLEQSHMSLLVPPSIHNCVTQYLEDRKEAIELEAARQANLIVDAAKWEAGRPAREAAAKEKARIRAGIIAKVEDLATKYDLDENDLLSPDDSPTWVYNTIRKIQSVDHFNESELTRLRESSHKYLAAAVHWREWRATGTPWNAVQSCSLLRKAKEPQKALKLLATVDFSEWDNKVTAALFTTQGGAQRDLELLDKSWASAQAAVAMNDASPHPFMLLGALCYQMDRQSEGDEYFIKAHERGASDYAIEKERLEAERRRIKTAADKTTRDTDHLY